MFGLGQLVLGLASGAENSNEMGHRQAVIPAGLQGRMNATMRSINRAMLVVGAPLGGFLGDAYGFRAILWVTASGLLVVAVVLGLLPFRTAYIGEPGEAPELTGPACPDRLGPALRRESGDGE